MTKYSRAWWGFLTLAIVIGSTLAVGLQGTAYEGLTNLAIFVGGVCALAVAVVRWFREG